MYGVDSRKNSKISTISIFLAQGLLKVIYCIVTKTKLETKHLPTKTKKNQLFDRLSTIACLRLFNFS